MEQADEFQQSFHAMMNRSTDREGTSQTVFFGTCTKTRAETSQCTGSKTCGVEFGRQSQQRARPISSRDVQRCWSIEHQHSHTRARGRQTPTEATVSNMRITNNLGSYPMGGKEKVEMYLQTERSINTYVRHLWKEKYLPVMPM